MLDSVEHAYIRWATTEEMDMQDFLVVGLDLATGREVHVAEESVQHWR
ncbi:hypothetical protein [Actinopolymorpha pittospori]